MGDERIILELQNIQNKKKRAEEIKEFNTKLRIALLYDKPRTATIKALDLLMESTALRDKLFANTEYYRAKMTEAGFAIAPGIHPIVPIMLGDAVIAQEMSRRMIEKGVYVVGFFYPVVPQGKARIRTQISAAHSIEDMDFAIRTSQEVRAEMQ